MHGVLAMVDIELKIARRNLWIVIVAGMMLLFSVVLSRTGSMSSSATAADGLAIAAANLTTLSVYLVPLIGLLLSFDAIAGERERGTFALLLSYPIERRNLLIGKLVAHLAVLAAALLIGFGAAAAMAMFGGSVSVESIAAMIRLFASSLCLGAAFLAAGYVISSTARQSTSAAGIAVAVWVVFVVLYDLALLAGLVADDGGVFTQHVFPWLLMANPADAFRTFNLLSSEAFAAGSGLVGAAGASSIAMSAASLLLWPVVLVAVANHTLHRSEP